MISNSLSFSASYCLTDLAGGAVLMVNSFSFVFVWYILLYSQYFGGADLI